MLIGAMVEFSPDAALAQNGEGILGPHGNVITGKKEFIEYCAQCHGMDATGDGPIAPDLKERPADLTQLVPKNGGVFPEQDVRAFIDGTKAASGHGTREMPSWGNVFRYGQGGAYSGRIEEAPESPALVKQRIDLLVDYIKSIQKK